MKCAYLLLALSVMIPSFAMEQKSETKHVHFPDDYITVISFTPEITDEDINVRLVARMLEKYKECKKLNCDPDGLCDSLERIFGRLANKPSKESWLKDIIDCVDAYDELTPIPCLCERSPVAGFIHVAADNNIFHYLARAQNLMHVQSPFWNSSEDTIIRLFTYLCEHYEQLDLTNEQLQDLLSAGFYESRSTDTGNTPLHLAIETNSGNIVRILAEHSHVDLRNAQGFAPLHIAAQNGVVGVVNALLEAGASINLTDAGGNTALHLAAQNQHAAVVALLLQRGASMTVQNEAGRSSVNYLLDVLPPGWVETLCAFVQNGSVEGFGVHQAALSPMMRTMTYIMTTLLATRGMNFRS